MCLTREQWKKHKEAIEWFYEQPEGTKIWYKVLYQDCPCYDSGWCLTSKPSWFINAYYIINDEYAELRKAIVDGRTIEFKDVFGNWIKEEYGNENPNNYDFYYPPENFRIKGE